MFEEMVKKAMKENRIDSQSEAENAIEFVEQLLEMAINLTKIEEPNATNSINQLIIAKDRVTDLYHDVNALDI